MPLYLSGDLERGLLHVRYGLGATKAVRIVVRVSSGVFAHIHKAVPLVVVHRCLGSVDGDHRVVYAETVDMGIVI